MSCSWKCCIRLDVFSHIDLGYSSIYEIWKLQWRYIGWSLQFYKRKHVHFQKTTRCSIGFDCWLHIVEQYSYHRRRNQTHKNSFGLEHRWAKNLLPKWNHLHGRRKMALRARWQGSSATRWTHAQMHIGAREIMWIVHSWIYMHFLSIKHKWNVFIFMNEWEKF